MYHRVDHTLCSSSAWTYSVCSMKICEFSHPLRLDCSQDPHLPPGAPHRAGREGSEAVDGPGGRRAGAGSRWGGAAAWPGRVLAPGPWLAGGTLRKPPACLAASNPCGDSGQPGFCTPLRCPARLVTACPPSAGRPSPVRWSHCSRPSASAGPARASLGS